VLEVWLITLQAWRRVPSHFNLETPFDGLVARTLAAGGGVLIAVIAVLTVASWRPDPQVAPSMCLAVRHSKPALVATQGDPGECHQHPRRDAPGDRDGMTVLRSVLLFALAEIGGA
jgi:hypothetical protein